MAEHSYPNPGGTLVKTGMNQCMRNYDPGVGGMQASAIEGYGDAGEIGEAQPSHTPGGKSDEGEYNHYYVSMHGDYPHSPADPEVGGPPLAQTNENDPTKATY